MNDSPIRRKFWEKKLQIARDNHRAEFSKMNGGGGASLRRLTQYADDIDKAKRELEKMNG